MPVYHARNITVRLGSMPLGETITSDVVLRKGEAAKRQSEAAEQKLLGSSYLDERRVLFPGDRNGFELNWLGNAPFMQAQVHPGLLQSPGSYASDHNNDNIASEYNRLHALALHVKLSDKAFLSGFSGKTHLKIEVLFNGQLSTCSLIHTNDIRSGIKSLHQIFAGYRVDFLAERPWVLLPPHTNPDGATRRFRKTITSRERWLEVSGAIQKEAEERGTNKYGESPPSATFLHALANMAIPEDVALLQKPGGRKFGVMDVIITSGYGNKTTTGTSYLNRPRRLGDPSYAVRTEIKSDDDVATVEPDSQGMGNNIINEAKPDVIATEAGDEDSDVIDERPRKRRDFSSFERLPQQSPKSSDFQNLFLGGQMPVLPPPAWQTFPRNLLPTAGTVSPRCPSSKHRSDGHKQPLPAKDHNRTYSRAYKNDSVQEWKNNASRISQEHHYSPLDPEIDALQADLANPTITRTPPSQSPFTSGSNGVLQFVSSPLASRSVPHIHGCQIASPPRSLYLNQVDTTDVSTHLAPSTPFVASTALMLPTAPSWSAPPSATTPPYHYPMRFQQPPKFNFCSYPPTFLSFMPPNGLPDLVPPTSPLHPYPKPAQFTTPDNSSSPLIQPCGQMPPTAMFSVPAKPRRSSSPDKGAARGKIDISSNTVLLNRPTITCRDGKAIVDHTLNTPQRIRAVARVHTSEDAHMRQSTLQHENCLVDRQIHERNDLSNNSSSDTSRATSPIKRLHLGSTEHLMCEQRRGNVVECALKVRLPFLKKHQGVSNEITPVNSRIDLPNDIALCVPANVLAIATSTPMPTPDTSISSPPAHPLVSQRCTFPRSPLPGIRGSKATTFLFDDPEEVLREAARMRRFRLSTKPAATPIVRTTTSITHGKAKWHQNAEGSSSPLSSVPSSPVSDAPADVHKTSDAALVQIPQLDGSPERTIPATSPRKLLTPSPKKLSFAAPKLQQPGPTSTQRSILPNAKKRKASSLSPIKLPRSADRLKTVDIPSLNDDCVIALAESVKKQEARGVLRQIKGERRGMFKEECVVLAVRFFISGD